MGIEFIRSRSRSHEKAQTREYMRAGGDLFAQATLPSISSMVFLARAVVAIEKLDPDTQVLLKAVDDHIDCFVMGQKVAIIEKPPAKLHAQISELPEGYCAGIIEERHIGASKLSIRVNM